MDCYCGIQSAITLEASEVGEVEALSAPFIWQTWAIKRSAAFYARSLVTESAVEQESSD
jgi:hypothetical protein